MSTISASHTANNPRFRMLRLGFFWFLLHLLFHRTIKVHLSGALVLGMVLCLQPAGATSSVTSTHPTLVLQEADAVVTLAAHMSVLEDASTTLQLSDILEPAKQADFHFLPAPQEAHNFSYTRSSYWFKLQLHNPSDQAERRMLEVANARLSSLQLYQQQADGSFSSVTTGLREPLSSRPYPNRYFVFPLSLPAQADTTLYLRVQSVMPLMVPAKLWNMDAYNLYNRTDYLIQWLYFGIALSMLLFNSLLLFSTRDTSYAWYLSLIVASSLSIASLTGIGKEYLWPDARSWAELAFYSCMAWTVSIFTQYTRITLQSHINTPKFDPILHCNLYIYALFPALLALFYQQIAKYAGIIIISGAILCLVTALQCAVQRLRIGYIFLLAFSVIVIGGTFTTLRGLGLLPSNAFTANALQFGSALEMILLAFLQADRFNQIRREKAADQAALLEEQRRHLNSLKENEVRLEQRVAERTAELEQAHNDMQRAFESATQEREQAERARQETEQALLDLQLAQQKLVQAEKMGALGLLVSNVAHEINSPNGAIQSSVQTVADAMQATLLNLPRLLESLSLENRTLFLRLLSQNQTHAASINTREERQIIKQVTTFLDYAGIEGAIRKARLIVKLRAHTNAGVYLPLLTHPDCDFILSVANGVSDVLSGTSNIQHASAKIGRIVASLRELSGGDRTLSMFENHLHQSMEKAIANLGSKLQDVDVVRNYQDMAPLRCDPEAIEQALMHLILNAAQAMEHRGTIMVGLRAHNNQAEIRIADFGCGIAPEIQDRIFEPFFTTRTSGEGGGMGLALVRKVVDQHQGTIQVQSNMGAGTTITMTLPYEKTS
jgi:signal transduction histidine kinase